jgi:RHS repeat-associated protein
LLDYRYSYDDTGNIRQKTTQAKTVVYDYDLLQRLTEALATTQSDTGEAQSETEGWLYDPNGNRTQDNLNPGSWDYDINDRLVSSPLATYSYDLAGNTLSKTQGGVTTTYHYNAEGRLDRVEDANQTLIAEYTYDPLGRRLRKRTQSETVYFHYADEGLVGEFDETASPIRIYGYHPDTTWTTDPIYQKTAQGYAYYQNDHLGMPQQLILKNGAKVWGGEFRAFGELTAETGSWENRLRFPGQYYDEESNHYYNYKRDYDPSTGRYLESDPLGLAGGINTYLYANANPLSWIDPDGEMAGAVGIGVIGIGSVIVVGSIIVNSQNSDSGRPGWWPPDVPHPSDSPKETTESTESCPTEPVENWDPNKTPPGTSRNFCAAAAAATFKSCRGKGNNWGQCTATATAVYLGCMMISGGGGSSGPSGAPPQ